MTGIRETTIWSDVILPDPGMSMVEGLTNENTDPEKRY